MNLDVSRETLERLRAFEALVKKWNPRVNLVSRSSLEFLWDRHILDSLQLFSLPADRRNWVDLGSGGGFPGLVVAVCLKEHEPESQVTMVESDQRKSAFLRTAIRELDLNAKIVTSRIEDAQSLNASTLSARALAPLSKLLYFSDRHLQTTGTAVFPKGETWEKEIEDACQEWSFQWEQITSETQTSASVLVIRDIQKR